MPSIEIVCVGLLQKRSPPGTTFDVAYEAGLTSHRVPSRFQRDFDATTGAMYHLGNPGQDSGHSGAFTAYELLSEECHAQEPPMFLEFGPSHVQSVNKLLLWLLEASPAGHLLFTSDYQFGPAGAARFGPVNTAVFWNLHDSRQLRMNALYSISGSSSGC
jgi:hypothetical protein